MKAYCVILRSHSFINPTSYPRTKRFYVRALTANRAVRAASELNPEFRVLGIEHSDLWGAAATDESSAPVSLHLYGHNSLPGKLVSA